MFGDEGRQLLHGQHQLATVGGGDGAQRLVNVMHPVSALVRRRNNERICGHNYVTHGALGQPVQCGVRQRLGAGEDRGAGDAEVDAVCGGDTRLLTRCGAVPRCRPHDGFAVTAAEKQQLRTAGAGMRARGSAGSRPTAQVLQRAR